MWSFHRKASAILIILLDKERLSLYAFETRKSLPRVVAHKHSKQEIPLCTTTFLNSHILHREITTFLAHHKIKKPLVACSLSQAMMPKNTTQMYAQRFAVQLLMQQLHLHCITLSDQTSCLQSLADSMTIDDTVDETFSNQQEAFGLFNQVKMIYGNSLLY